MSIDPSMPGATLPGPAIINTTVGQKTEDKVDSPSLAYLRMSIDWKLILDLLGGTRSMRAAGSTYLPKWDGEEVKQWQGRLSRTFLYNALKNTIRRMTTKPFSKPVTVKLDSDQDSIFTTLVDDVDSTGCDITQFAKELFVSGLKFGLVHIFVDYTNIQVKDSQGKPRTPTLADEKAAGARPRFAIVEAPQLIGWRWETVNGSKKLTQIRWREVKSEAVGMFGEQDVEYIWVVDRERFQAYRKTPNDKEFFADPDKGGAHSFGEVPLITLYFDKTGFMEAEPPLTDIAWLNVEHWQSSSDQRHILSLSRFAILFGRGFSEDQVKAGITIGPARFVGTTDDKGELKFVEIQGTAIDAGRQDLQDLQQRMEVLGLQPIIARTKDATATGKRIDEGRVITDVQAWVRATENAIYEAFEMAGRWVKQDLPEGFAVDIFSDFGISQEDVRMFQTLLSACQAGKLSLLTFLQEAKRRGVLADSVEPDEEMDRIEEEGPPLGLVGPNGLPPDPDDDPDDDPSDDPDDE